MALTIEGATVGYDENSMRSTLNHVHNNCIETAKSTLRSNLAELNTRVNECWVGQSAENWKGNMQKMVDEYCKELDEAYKILEGQFKEVLAGLTQIDETIMPKM